MQLILDDNMYTEIWDTTKIKFNYPQSFSYNGDYKSFKISSLWNEQQENIVNEILKRMANKNIYALDWQHDCFIFNPYDNIPMNTEWYDNERECNVYFPTYYPNGDYHAFVAMDYTYGIFGYPWSEEIYIVGEKLINLFNEYKSELNLIEQNL